MPPAIRVNGGTAGVKASVSASSAWTAALDSTTGVRSTVWSVLSTDETSSTASYTLTQSGSVGQNVASTSLGVGTALLLKAVINGGVNLQTGLPDPDATTATVKIYVPTSAGLEVGCAGEEYESDATFGSTGLLNAGIRLASTLAPSGIPVKIVKAATASALPANTRSGNVLTANANGAFPALDTSVTISVGDRFLAQNEGGGASHVNNGIFTLTTAGSGGTPWTATRATDFDESGELVQGTAIIVQQGTTYAGRLRYLKTASATVNVTALEFDSFGDVVSVSGSAPIASSGGSTPTISWNPTANVGMLGYGFTACPSVVNAGGAVAITAGAGAASLAGSTTATVSANGGALTLEGATTAALTATSGACTITSSSEVNVSPLLNVRRDDASTNTTLAVATLRRTTAGTAANGIGASLGFELEDAAGNVDTAATIATDYLDATSTSEDARLLFRAQVAGSLTDSLSLRGTTVRAHGLAGSGVRIVTADANGDLALASANATNQLALALTSATTNSEIFPVGIFARSSGTTAAGFGPTLDFYAHSDAGTDAFAGRFALTWTDPTDGAETSRLDVTIADAGGGTSVFSATPSLVTIPIATQFSAAPTVVVDDTTNNNVSTVLTLTHTTSGAATNNIGSRVVMRAEDSAGNTEDAVYLDAILTNATNTTEASEFSVWTRTGGGAAAKALAVAGSGAVTIASSLDRISAGALAIAPTTATSVTITPDTTVTGDLTAGRLISAPATPTSAANAVTFDLSATSNIFHTTTENTTVTITGGTSGQSGVIVVSQGAVGRTVTMPTDGVGVEYDNTIEALGLTAIIDATLLTRTILAYYVLPNGKAFIYSRGVVTIP